MRGLDGKYRSWEEILCDIRGIDDDGDDEEMPEETWTPKLYDTSERDGRCAPIRMNPEEDALQIHTDGEISGENIKTNIRRSNLNSKTPNRYGSKIFTENFWGLKNKVKYTLSILQVTSGPE